MKTRKKLLIALLSATCLTAGAFGLAACDKESNDPALYGIYTAYVTEANEKNETPLSYEEWLKDKFSSVGEKGEDGKDGEDGQPGANGQSAYQIYVESVYKADPDAQPMTEAQWLASLNGVTPHIGDNGNWYLGTIDTGVKAAGVDGEGIKSITMSADGKTLVVTLTSGKTVSVNFPDLVIHTHTYNDDYTILLPGEGGAEGLGYKKCTQNGCEHLELFTFKSPAKGSGYEDSRYEFSTGSNTETYYLKTHKDGRWMDNTYITFTASRAGAYTFSNVEGIAGYVGYTQYDGGEFTLVLARGDKVEFQMQTSNFDDLDGFLLTVSFEVATEGSAYLPVSAANNDKTSYTAENNQEIYFKIDRPNEETKVKVTFNEGVTVYALGGSATGDRKPLTSGDYVDFAYTSYGMTMRYQEYYLVASASDGNIEFTTEPIFLEGEKGMPAEFEGAGTYYLSSAPEGSTQMWYTLEVDEETTFTFDQSSNASNSSFYFYSGEEISEYNPDYNSSSGKIAFTFQSDTVYFIRVTNFTEESQFTVRAFDATEDAGISPKAPLAATAELETVAGDKYYVYTVESDGYVLISSNSYVDAKIYTDESFTGSYLGLSYNSSKSNYANSVKVSVGDKIYLNVNDYTGGKTIAITEIANDVQYDYSVTVQEDRQPVAGFKVSLVDENEAVVATTVTDENGVATFKVSPGTYSVTPVFEGDFEYYKLSGSAGTVSPHLNSATLNVAAPVIYKITVTGLEGLEGVENVKVGLYEGRYDYIAMQYVYDELVEEFALKDGKVEFEFDATSSYYGYQLQLIGLPEGYTAAPANLYNVDITLTVVPVGGGDEGDDNDDNDDNNGDEESNFTEVNFSSGSWTNSGSESNNFKFSSEEGSNYTFTVTGGNITSFIVDNDECFNADGSLNNSGLYYMYGSTNTNISYNSYGEVIMFTVSEGATVTITVS